MKSRIRPYLGYGIGIDTCYHVRPYLGYGVDMRSHVRLRLGYGVGILLCERGFSGIR
ncbi:hypothetical protein F383_25318 [Gossypium arboreum]|uniref:Uncharacterized protein n=1 Tax=Gossypium arboreum TaxID=29729 RepID=A0A0B0P5N2_GOSAR|nr:hypothetical protein F383_25318 [Gossypium arboreum]